MGKVLVNGIQLYAYHGCMEEEGKVGRSFIVDVMLETDFSKAEQTDQIGDTVNYVTVYELVKREMDIRSHLIEHVGRRIVNALQATFPQVKSIEVKVTKLHPPINGNVDSTAVIITN